MAESKSREVSGEFAENLKIWMQSHGYTQRTAAEVLGIKPRTFEGWCSGRFTPSHTDAIYMLMAAHDRDRAGSK